MRKIAVGAVALAMLVALCAPAVAGEAGKDVKLTGWVSDECCAAKNANAEGKACTLECHKNGSKLVFYSEGKTYKLADQKSAIEHVGQEVQVTGKVSEDGTLKIATFEPAKKKA